MGEPIEMWGVVNPEGLTLANTIRLTPAKSKGCWADRCDQTWASLEERGYRCVRFEVRVIEETACPACKGNEVVRERSQGMLQCRGFEVDVQVDHCECSLCGHEWIDPETTEGGGE